MVILETAVHNQQHTPRRATGLDVRPTTKNHDMGFKLGPGDVPLDGYTIRRGLGCGGFGEVYLAVTGAGKEVALKRIHRNLEVEVRGATHCLNLRHPNLVGLFDIRQPDSEQAWIVMEYVSGEILKDLLDRSPTGLTVDQALHYFGQMGAAVEYLHSQGIVHRDLKPANVFVEHGFVKIGDYGLSKFISTSRRGGQTESVGTFHYMAPEIGKGEYGKEIDIYALGIILFEMLTGQVPFDGQSTQEIILKHLTEEPDVSRLDEPYRHVIARALAKDPATRYPSVAAMLDELGMEIDNSGMVVRHRRAEGGSPAGMNRAAGAKTGSEKSLSFDSLESLAKKRYYREPLANELATGLARFRRSIDHIPFGTPGYAIVLMAIIVILIVWGPIIVTTSLVVATCYLPYYALWSLFGGGRGVTQGKDQAAVPVSVQPGHKLKGMPSTKARPRPVSFQEWQWERRRELAMRPAVKRWIELTESMMRSIVMLTALAAIGFLVGKGVDSAWTRSSGFIAIGSWTTTMTLLSTWLILFFAKRWETRPEDTLTFRFAMLTGGMVLGGIGWGLSEFLMVPWTSESWPLRGTTDRLWEGFYVDGAPHWPAFVAYFGLLMGSVRWWRQGDLLRRHRWSLLSILWSTLVAAFIGGFLYFPTPWSLLIAGSTSLLVQMATTIVDSRQRAGYSQIQS